MSVASLVEMLPRYQRVRWEIERYLGGLEIGQKIMTEHEVVAKFNVSRITARRALMFLREEGILESKRGRGTFYVKPIGSDGGRSAQQKIVGILVPSVTYVSIGKIVQGIEAEATRRGYHIILAHDHNESKEQIAHLRKMMGADIAGLLLYPDRSVTERGEFVEVLRQIEEQKLPLVLLDRYLPGFDFPCVMNDNVRGSYMVTEHLIGSGRRRLAYIGNWSKNSASIERRQGFVEALRDHGLAPTPVAEGEVGTVDDIAHEAGYRITSRWIAGNRARDLPFDGIVCEMDEIAFGVYAALEEAGLRVPEDVALCGYDNKDSMQFRGSGLQLTSVQQPLEAIGANAVGLLIDQLENRPRAGGASRIILPPALIIRTSCGTKGASPAKLAEVGG